MRVDNTRIFDHSPNHNGSSDTSSAATPTAPPTCLQDPTFLSATLSQVPSLPPSSPPLSLLGICRTLADCPRRTGTGQCQIMPTSQHVQHSHTVTHITTHTPHRSPISWNSFYAGQLMCQYLSLAVYISYYTHTHTHTLGRTLHTIIMCCVSNIQSYIHDVLISRAVTGR